jgi:hypothetical protein
MCPDTRAPATRPLLQEDTCTQSREGDAPLLGNAVHTFGNGSITDLEVARDLRLGLTGEENALDQFAVGRHQLVEKPRDDPAGVGDGQQTAPGSAIV